MECQPPEVLIWSRTEQQLIRFAVVVATCALKFTLPEVSIVNGVGFVWDAVQEKVETDLLPALFLLVGRIGGDIGYVLGVGCLSYRLLA
jgi:hypothetical protein